MKNGWLMAVALAAVVPLLTACPAEDPEDNTGDDGGQAGDGGGGTGGEGGGGGGAGGAGGGFDCDPWAEDVTACAHAANDYEPRDAAANDDPADPWPACISDDDTYHEVDPNVSTIARVAAYEQIADLLWRNAGVPTAADFTEARVLYAQDQGLDSRVSRRYDPHFPKPAAGGCEDAGVPEANPDYCVGPAKLLPELNDAFAKGQTGESPRLQAARIQAALDWFLFVSVHKENRTCQAVPKDCDSGWAYYTGGVEREQQALGVGGLVSALGPETHDRIFDAILAARCWRDLEGAAVDNFAHPELLAAYEAQLDASVDRGAAIVARTRLQELGCSTGDDREEVFTYLKGFLPYLDRSARLAGAAHADAIAAVAGAADAATAADLAQAAIDAIDAVYDCP